MDKTDTLRGYSIGLALCDHKISRHFEESLRQVIERKRRESQQRVIGVLGNEGLGSIGKLLAEQNLWARLHPNCFYRTLTDTTDRYALPVCEEEFLEPFKANGQRMLAFAAQTGGFSESRDQIFKTLSALIQTRKLSSYTMSSIVSPIDGYGGAQVEPGLRVISPSLEGVETLVKY